jgi:hypothetical protein
MSLRPRGRGAAGQGWRRPGKGRGRRPASGNLQRGSGHECGDKPVAPLLWGYSRSPGVRSARSLALSPSNFAIAVDTPDTALKSPAARRTSTGRPAPAATRKTLRMRRSATEPRRAQRSRS